MPSGKVVGPLNWNQKVKTHFMALIWLRIWRWFYALVGEPDQAITLIERLLSTPGPVGLPDFPNNITLADLRLRWE